MNDRYCPACGLTFYAHPKRGLMPEFCPRCLARSRRHITLVQRPQAPVTSAQIEQKIRETRKAVERARHAMSARSATVRERTEVQIEQSRDRLERAHAVLQRAQADGGQSQ